MNSLGGSKGERNAKPKFAALDINKLYITSRGESLEPSTQKTTTPRKHGMQSLGKVPSARRAPANLPSLKAEVSNPSDNSGSWSVEQPNNNNGVNSQANDKCSNSFSLTDCRTISDTDSQNNPQYLSNSKIIPSTTATWNTIEFPSLDDTGLAGASAVKVVQPEQLPSAGLLSLRSQGDTKKWIHQQTSGGRVGTATTSSSMASSLEGGSKDGRGQNIQNVPTQSLIESPLPPQFRALLPSFMRGNDVGSTGIPNNGVTVSSSSSQPHVLISPIQRNSSNSVMPSFAQSHGKLPHHGIVSLDSRNSTNSRVGSGGANYPPKISSTSGRIRNLGHGNGVSGSTGGHERGNTVEGILIDHHYGGRRGGPLLLSRHRGGANLAGVMPSSCSGIPPRVGSGISDVSDTIAMKDDQRYVLSSGSLSDQESIVVRPIIRDEELQRLEAISKDEGWSKDYEFDYNQKLEFSDDEMEPSIPLTDSDNKYDAQLIPEVKEENSTNDKDIENNINEKKDVHDREHGLHRNIGQHSRPATTPTTTSSIVGGVLDVAEAKERLIQRREEDQKREQERKQAAAKKLLELERKLSRKKSEEVATANNASGSEIVSSKVISNVTHTTINAAEENKLYCTTDTTEAWGAVTTKLTSKSGERGETRYEYLGTRNDRDRDVGNGTNAMNRDAPAFSKSFQSNLPPRFQRRKLERNTSGSNTLHTIDGPNSGRTGVKGMTCRDMDDAKSDPVPFSQQYDPRFIHNQQNHFLSAKAARHVETENQLGKLKRSEHSDRNEKEVIERDIEVRSCDQDQRKEDRENSINVAQRNSKATVNIEFLVSNEKESSSLLNTNSSIPPLARRSSEKSCGEHKITIPSDDNLQAHKKMEYAGTKISLANSGSFVQKTSWDEDICVQEQFQASSQSTESSVSLLKHDTNLKIPTCERIENSVSDRELHNAVTNKSSLHVLNKDEERQPISGSSSKNKLLDDELHVFESKQGFQLKQMSCYDNEDIYRPRHEIHEQSSNTENVVEPLVIPSSPKDFKTSEYPHNNRAPDSSDIYSVKTAVSKNSVTAVKEGENMSSLQHPGNKKKITSVQQPPRERRHDSRIAEGTRNNPNSVHQRVEAAINRGNTAANWNRSRGAGKICSRNYNQDYWSESDFSEEGLEDDQLMRNKANCAAGSKYQHHYQPQHFKTIPGEVCIKEGFAPRGEPSRRGRGGGSAISSVSFRKKTGQGGAPLIGKKVDCYGPPSSKSPFRGSDSTISVTNNLEDQSKGCISVSDNNNTSANWARNVSKSCNNAIEDAQSKDDKKTTSDDDCDKLSRQTVSQIVMVSEVIPKQMLLDKHSTNTLDMVLSKELAEKTTLSSEQCNSLENKSTIFTCKGTISLKAKNPANSVENNSSFEHVVSRSSLSSTTSNVLNSHSSRIEKKSKEGSIDCDRMQINDKDDRASPEFSCDYDENSCKTTKKDRITTSEDGHYSDLCTEGNSFAQIKDIETLNQTMSNPATGAQTKQQSLEDSNKSVSMNVKTDNNKHHLDGSSPPVKTIIFENTNYKSTVVSSPNNAALGSSMNNACLTTSVTVVGNNNNTTTKRPQNNKITNSTPTGKDGLENVAFKVTSSTSETVTESVVTAGKSLQSVVGTMPHRSVSLTTGAGCRAQSVTHQQLQSSNTTMNTYQAANYQKEADFEQEIKSFAFESDISQLIDTNKVAKQCTAIAPSTATCLPSHSSSSSATTVSVQKIVSPSTADLNMKIASVKKVWEMPNISKQRDVVAEDSIVISSGADGNEAGVHTTTSYCTIMHPGHSTNYQHNVIGNTDQLSTAQGSSPYTTFPQDQGALERRHFVSANANKSTGAMSEGGIVVIATVPGAVTTETDDSTKSYSHSVDVLAAAAAASSANVCKVKPTQQGMHQSGNLDLSPPPSMQSGTIPSAPQPYYPAQYGVSAVPSPPAVLYNSAAAITSQGGLYNAFQLEANGRSQFSQFPGHYGSSGASGPYNAYMATPTNIPTANPTPEIYQSITSQFRLGSVQSPYGNQAAQLNNPSTMLISSNNNSLMSSSVKSTSQQIGTIGSKSGGAVGQPPYGQQYMGMFPPAPLQNSAANFYSNSAGGQNAFFGASAAGSTQAYGIPTAVATANIFSGHGGQNPSSGHQPPPQQQQMPNYGSQFLSSPLLGNNPVVGQQQYRGGPSNSSQNTANANAVFMKSNQPQQPSHIQQQQQQQDTVSFYPFYPK
uniref:BAT2_N domain-containing protein n=1 Tax=Anopheles albimanus TaxID=7167 RepID=A0A182FT67_ANOAL